MLEHVPGAESEECTLGAVAKALGSLEGHHGKALCYVYLPLEPVDSQAKSYIVKHTNVRPSDPEDSCCQQPNPFMFLERQLPFLSRYDFN